MGVRFRTWNERNLCKAG